MGITLSDAESERTYNRFIELADKKKHIYDDDLLAIVREAFDALPNAYELDYLHVSTGTSTVPTATVRLKKGGKVLQDASCGDGPVDAALKTVDRITGIQGKLIDFSVQAVTVGKDAMGEASVRVAFDGEIVSAKAASTDIVEAAIKAYLSCVNRVVSGRSAGQKASRAAAK